MANAIKVVAVCAVLAYVGSNMLGCLYQVNVQDKRTFCVRSGATPEQCIALYPMETK